MPSNLEIKQSLADKGVVVLHLHGVLDANTFEQFSNTVEELMSSGKYRLLLDLQDVDYMSSSGAGVIITSLPKAQANNGNIVLLNPTDKVHQVLMLLGLTDVVKVELSKTAALEHF